MIRLRARLPGMARRPRPDAVALAPHARDAAANHGFESAMRLCTQVSNLPQLSKKPAKDPWSWERPQTWFRKQNSARRRARGFGRAARMIHALAMAPRALPRHPRWSCDRLHHLFRLRHRCGHQSQIAAASPRTSRRWRARTHAHAHAHAHRLLPPQSPRAEAAHPHHHPPTAAGRVQPCHELYRSTRSRARRESGTREYSSRGRSDGTEGKVRRRSAGTATVAAETRSGSLRTCCHEKRHGHRNG